ncbi:aldo/keto reductase [Bengtsoniella intestinalis]|uniref:aldo/keto reductase n=1 Tax=Bengtsoniella intestinalis TaxID=3073143 RepID=UPI00391F8AA3
MDKIRLGRTELMVSKTSFGALPIQRISKQAAVDLMRLAFDNGVNYYDTANAYSDSEEKIGEAFHSVRDQIVISTKSMAKTKEGVLEHIEKSLRSMRTDYVDLFQFHNPAILPNPEDPDGAYAGAVEAQKRGYIRHIGITNHRLDVAFKAVESGDFATMQFPFSYLSGQGEVDLIAKCKEADMGFIAMKGLAGGLLTNSRACYVFMQQHPTVVPIWGCNGKRKWSNGWL